MRYIYSLIFILLVVSCDKPQFSSQSSQLIVEGWIEDGGYPVVMLTKSVNLSSEYQESGSLSDNLIRWAKVSVTDGKDTVVLTGKYDKGYYPPYIYTTSHLKGEAGKTYSLIVEYEQFHAVANTIIPATVPIDTLYVEKVESSDSAYSISIAFRDAPAEKNYYQLFSRVGGNNRQFLASYLGSLDDERLHATNEVPVYQGHQLGVEYTPFFHTGDTVAIKLAHIDKCTFDFWDAYIKNISLENNMFFSSKKEILGNVTGGYGCWYGMGASTRYVIIP